MPAYLRRKGLSKVGRRRDLTERLEDIEMLLEELLARSNPSVPASIGASRPRYMQRFVDRAKWLTTPRAKQTVRGVASRGLRATTSAEGECL